MTPKTPLLATIKQDTHFFSGKTLNSALRERYAQGAGVSAFPFRRLPANLPVSLGERRQNLSPLFDQGRQNP